MMRIGTSNNGSAFVELPFAILVVALLLVVIAKVAHIGLTGANAVIQADAEEKRIWIAP